MKKPELTYIYLIATYYFRTLNNFRTVKREEDEENIKLSQNKKEYNYKINESSSKTKTKIGDLKDNMTNNTSENNETNLMNKFNGKPPYNFNQKDAKEIDIKYIEVSKEDLIEDNNINSNNKWYKNLNYLEKLLYK